jgi:hypothetical protein
MSAASILRSLISSTKSREIWEVIAGPSTGATISMQIGLKHRLKVPLTNPHLTEEQRQFEGEVGFFIECPWRVHTETNVICSWSDDNAIDGPMVVGLRTSLLGSPIETADLEAVTMDLHVRLVNGVHLTVFCDSVDGGEDNYSVFDREFAYIVGPRGKVRRERRLHDVRAVLRGV